MSPAALAHCTAPSEVANGHAAVAHAAPTIYRIELTGALRQRGVLYVALRDERHNWLVECRPKDLATFQRFRRRVDDELGIAIDHESQDSGRFADRREGWSAALRNAYQRGDAA